MGIYDLYTRAVAYFSSRADDCPSEMIPKTFAGYKGVSSRENLEQQSTSAAIMAPPDVAAPKVVLPRNTETIEEKLVRETEENIHNSQLGA